MIITLIGLGILIIGIVLVILAEKTCIFDRFYGDIDLLGGIFILIGTIISIGCIVLILCKEVGENNIINKNKMKYESLQRRVEIVNSEYEDVSRSDLIKDINEWNEEVYNQKYWTENPWTNWFFNQKIADELEYIDFEEVAK